MKVVFKLTSSQVKNARRVVEVNKAFFEKKAELLASWPVVLDQLAETEYQLYYRPELAEKLVALKAKKEAIASELLAGEYEITFAAGNCWQVTDHPSANDDVSLVLTGNILTFQGQRCPLIQDGCIERIFEIAGFQKPADHRNTDEFRQWYKSCCQQLPEVLRVVEYQTSDRRLAWYESLDGYMRSGKPSLEEILEYKGATLDLFERFPDVLNNVRLYQKDPKRAHVFLTKAELALVKKSVKLECFN